MFATYSDGIDSRGQANAEETFVASFRKGSPFEQPWISFLSAIVGSELLFLPEVTFRQVFHKNHSMEFPGFYILRFSVRLRDARKIVLSSIWSYEANLVISMAQQLVVFCYAAVEDYDDGSTEFDFFRHLRNACAHGNQFTFKSKVTGLPARWRGAEIDRNSEGRIAIPEFVGIPDVILLLKDIEARLPLNAFRA